VRARYDLTPRRARELKARGTRAARDLRAARPACWRRSRGRARGDGGRGLRFSAGITAYSGNAQGQRERDSPRRMDGDARLRNRSRARTPRRSCHPEVAPGVPMLRQAQNRYAAPDALASTTEATRQRCSVSLDEPGTRIKHATPGHPSRDVFRQATLEMADYDSTASWTAKLLSDRLGDSHCYSPASYDARAVMRLTAPSPPATP
jgi:hypothetical protein